MGRAIRVMSIVTEGDSYCNHEFACNPTSDMVITKGRMLFMYDRVCVKCGQREKVESNMVGYNTQKYYSIVKK